MNNISQNMDLKKDLSAKNYKLISTYQKLNLTSSYWNQLHQDLLINIMPKICKKFPMVDFIIAGDGPYRVKIDEVKERNFLNDRQGFWSYLLDWKQQKKSVKFFFRIRLCPGDQGGIVGKDTTYLDHGIDMLRY